MAPRSPRIIYSGFCKGGWGARSDLKAADWNYDHLMFDLAIRDPGYVHFGKTPGNLNLFPTRWGKNMQGENFSISQ